MDKFQKALQNNRDAIFAALRYPNPIARAQTISKLIEHGVFDDDLVAAVKQLVGDSERALFGETVGDVAKRYLSRIKEHSMSDDVYIAGGDNSLCSSNEEVARRIKETFGFDGDAEEKTRRQPTAYERFSFRRKA